MECVPNTSFNQTSYEAYDNFMFYKHLISGWFTLIVIIPGIIANFITICVLLNHSMRKTSTNAYLLALTFSNILSLICLTMMIGLRFTLVYPYRKVYCVHWYESFINLAMPYLTPVNNLFQLSGIYLTTAVSLDRYFLIAKNVQESIRRRQRHKYTWYVIVFIFVFSALYTIPNWFLYQSEIDTISVKNNNFIPSINLTTTKLISYIRTSKTKFGTNPMTNIVLQIYLYIPIVFFIPVLILLVVNFLIIYKIIGIAERKRQLGNIAKIDRSITIMLVLIVVFFMVGQVPLMATSIMSTIIPNIGFNNSFAMYNTFANFILCLNLSSNFALYCVFNEKFRKTIKLMLKNNILSRKSDDFQNDLSRNNLFSNYFGTVTRRKQSGQSQAQSELRKCSYEYVSKANSVQFSTYTKMQVISSA